jgi:DNA-binding transcriptional MerR regulator/quercetin dioxygenase-like cupin family protein
LQQSCNVVKRDRRPVANAEIALSKRGTSANIRHLVVPKTRATKSRVSTSRRATPASRYGFLTVGQTAKILGVSPSTLRLWESEGLIAPIRTTGRYRLYSPELLKVLKRIKYLREVQRLNMPGIKRELKDVVASNGAPQVATPDLAPSGNGGSASASMSTSGVGGRAMSKMTVKPDRTLGPQLRRMRERKKLNLAEAARRAGVSPGFLSAVERSLANASVATLQRLAMSYGTTVMELFQTAPHDRRLVTPAERRVLEVHNGVRMELLSFGAPMLQSMLFRVAPLAGSEGAYSHQGEEFIFMVSGTLEVWLDELECFILREGDSFWFPSTHAHRWFNAGNVDAVLLWINTPPTF